MYVLLVESSKWCQCFQKEAISICYVLDDEWCTWVASHLKSSSVIGRGTWSTLDCILKVNFAKEKIKGGNICKSKFTSLDLCLIFTRETILSCQSSQVWTTTNYCSSLRDLQEATPPSMLGAEIVFRARVALTARRRCLRGKRSENQLSR